MQLREGTEFSRLTATGRVLNDITLERDRQDEKFGEQNWPDGTGAYGNDLAAQRAKDICEVKLSLGNLTWRHILNEEVAEAYAESDPAKLRAELIQVAAVACAWAEAIDRRGA